MTVKDALASGFNGLQVGALLLERSLLQAGINNGSEDYVPSEHDSKIELAQIEILFALWGGVKSISEGDMSVSFDDERKAKLLLLAKKHRRRDILSVLDDTPKIKRVRKW